jgi:hypothetical protein
MDALTGAYKFGGRFLGVMRTRFRLRPDEQARWCPYVAPHIPRGTGGEAGGKEKASPASTGSPAASATPRRFLEGYRTADRHRHGGRQVLLDMRGVFAKFETNLRRERQLEGIAKAKAAGVYRGRPAPIDAPQERAMKAQRFGATEIAKALNIGRASVYGYWRRGNNRCWRQGAGVAATHNSLLSPSHRSALSAIQRSASSRVEKAPMG